MNVAVCAGADGQPRGGKEVIAFAIGPLAQISQKTLPSGGDLFRALDQDKASRPVRLCEFVAGPLELAPWHALDASAALSRLNRVACPCQVAVLANSIARSDDNGTAQFTGLAIIAYNNPNVLLAFWYGLPPFIPLHTLTSRFFLEGARALRRCCCRRGR